MKLLKYTLLLILCFIASIIIGFQVLDDIILRITASEVFYIITPIVITLLLFNFILSIKNSSISDSKINIFAIIYITFVISITFLKGSYNSEQTCFNLNPLNILRDFKSSSNTLLLLVGNI